jgi:hypothetical protein
MKLLLCALAAYGAMGQTQTESDSTSLEAGTRSEVTSESTAGESDKTDGESASASSKTEVRTESDSASAEVRTETSAETSGEPSDDKTSGDKTSGEASGSGASQTGGMEMQMPEFSEEYGKCMDAINLKKDAIQECASKEGDDAPPSCACVKKFSEALAKVWDDKECTDKEMMNRWAAIILKAAKMQEGQECKTAFETFKTKAAAWKQVQCSVNDMTMVMPSMNRNEELPKGISKGCSDCLKKNQGLAMYRCFPDWHGEKCNSLDLEAMASAESTGNHNGPDHRVLSKACNSCFFGLTKDYMATQFDKKMEMMAQMKEAVGTTGGGQSTEPGTDQNQNADGDRSTDSNADQEQQPLDESGDQSLNSDPSTGADPGESVESEGRRLEEDAGHDDHEGHEGHDGHDGPDFHDGHDGPDFHDGPDHDGHGDDDGFEQELVAVCFFDGGNPEEKLYSALKSCGMKVPDAPAEDWEPTDAEKITACRMLLSDETCQKAVSGAGALVSKQLSHECSQIWDWDEVEKVCPNLHAEMKAVKFCEGDDRACDEPSDKLKKAVCGDLNDLPECAKWVQKNRKGKDLQHFCGPDREKMEKCIKENLGKDTSKCLEGAQLSRKAKTEMKKTMRQKEVQGLRTELKSALSKCDGDDKAKRACTQKAVSEKIKDLPKNQQNALKREMKKQAAADMQGLCAMKPTECLDMTKAAISDLLPEKATEQDKANAAKLALAESVIGSTLTECVAEAFTDEARKLCRKAARAALTTTGAVEPHQAPLVMRKAIVNAAAEVYTTCMDEDGAVSGDCIADAKSTFLEMGGSEARFEKMKANVLRTYNNMKNDIEVLVKKLDNVEGLVEIEGMTPAKVDAKASAIKTALEGLPATCATKVSLEATVETTSTTSAELDFDASCTGECCGTVEVDMGGASDIVQEKLNEARRRLRMLLEDEDVSASVYAEQETQEVPVDQVGEDGTVSEDFNPDSSTGSGESGVDEADKPTGGEADKEKGGEKSPPKEYSGASAFAVGILSSVLFLF